jgi:hypothetical protein
MWFKKDATQKFIDVLSQEVENERRLLIQNEKYNVKVKSTKLTDTSIIKTIFDIEKQIYPIHSTNVNLMIPSRRTVVFISLKIKEKLLKIWYIYESLELIELKMCGKINCIKKGISKSCYSFTLSRSSPL